jgi:hypothetical protein
MSDGTTGGGQRRLVHQENRVPPEVIAGRVVWWVFGAVDVIIALRFVLRLLGANPAAGFTSFVYTLSGIPMAPFLAVFPTEKIQGASVFELSALLAIAIYALVAWAIVAAIRAAMPRESVATVEQSERVEPPSTGNRR